MAIGSATVANEEEQYNGKVTSFVVLSCVVACMGGIIFGYSEAITDGLTSMKPFLEEFFPSVLQQTMRKEEDASSYCRFRSSHRLNAFSSSLYVAGMFSSVAAAPVTRTRGRRVTMAIGGAVSLAGAALGTAAVNVGMLIVSRVLLGLGVGFASQAVPIYLSEMAPTRHRGAFGIGFRFSQSVGSVLATLINFGIRNIGGGLRWRVSLSLAGIPALFLTLGALLLRETPVGIIQRGGGIHKAVGALQRNRGTSDVLSELDDIVAPFTVDSAAAARPFWEIARRKYRPQLVMAIAIPFFSRLTGFHLVASHAPVLLGAATGIDEGASTLAALVLGLTGAAANIVSMVLVDRLGRRATYMIGGAQMFSSLVAIGGVMAARTGDGMSMSRGYVHLLLALVFLHAAGSELSWGALGWSVPSEMFPLEVRLAGQSIAVAVNFLFAFVTAQTFGTMHCAFKSATPFFFAGWVLAMTAFVYLLLPETKNTPMERMERVWREHWFWRRLTENVHTDQPIVTS